MGEPAPKENSLGPFLEACRAWEHDPSAQGARRLIQMLKQNREWLEERARENEVRFYNFDDTYQGALDALKQWLDKDDPMQVDVARRCLSEMARFIG
jgi:hypothetical protein